MKDSQEEINSLYRSLVEHLGEAFTPLVSRGKGHHGWRKSYEFGKTNCILAIGGQRGRALLSFSGQTCGHVHIDAWPRLIQLIRGGYKGRITRWDGACDDFHGIHGVEWATEQYKKDGFSSGGNRPSSDLVGDWLANNGRGRSLYVGSRKNGKLVRIYEKGRQLGQKDSPWVRWELELHRKDREIPWEVLLDPAPFIAGAYPCMHWISATTARVRTYKDTSKIGYKYLTECAKQAYGQHINVMLEVEGSPEKVIQKLRRHGVPKRLNMPVPPEYKGGAVYQEEQ